MDFAIMITSVIGVCTSHPSVRSDDSYSRSKHCANRTHRLRSTLKVTHGRGREFKKPPVVPQDKIQDGQFVAGVPYLLCTTLIRASQPPTAPLPSRACLVLRTRAPHSRRSPSKRIQSERPAAQRDRTLPPRRALGDAAPLAVPGAARRGAS